MGTWSVFLRTGKKFRYVAGRRHCSLARSRGVAHVRLYRLPHGVVVLAEVGSGEGHPAGTVTTLPVLKSEDVASNVRL